MNELKRLREESTGGKALLQRGTGKMDMSEDPIAKRTVYAEAFRKAAEKYKESLRASMKWSTASVQELYQEILEDIDHSIDYYDRLAKGEEVWRTESTRYRDESPIDHILVSCRSWKRMTIRQRTISYQPLKRWKNTLVHL